MVKAAGRSWFVLAAMAGLGLGWVACKDAGLSDTSALSGVQAATLEATGPEVIEPALERFSEANQASVDALEALSADPSDPTLWEAAQQAHLEAVYAWQTLELMQIGPAGSSITVIGGEDLRDELYSFPSTNPCRVDQETAAGEWTEADYFESRLANAYGLDAVEHLLFGPAEHSCPSQVGLDADWDAMDDAQLAQARADQAHTLALHNQALADALLERWRGEWSGVLAEAADPYASQQEALNAVFHALFYAEELLKLDKLRIPLGLEEEEGAPESPEAGASLLYVRGNLQGFSELFHAGEENGFDAILEEGGHGDLVTQVDDALAAANEALDAMPEDLSAAQTSHPQELEQLVDAIDTLGTLLKTDLATTLTLEVPSESAGDND